MSFWGQLWSGSHAADPAPRYPGPGQSDPAFLEWGKNCREQKAEETRQSIMGMPRGDSASDLQPRCPGPGATHLLRRAGPATEHKPRARLLMGTPPAGRGFRIVPPSSRSLPCFSAPGGRAAELWLMDESPICYLDEGIMRQ